MVPMVPQPEWRVKPAARGGPPACPVNWDLSPLIGQLLVQRGYEDPAAAHTFLSPELKMLTPPQGLRGLERACHVLAPAVTSGTTIGVAGDYDAVRGHRHRADGGRSWNNAARACGLGPAPPPGGRLRVQPPGGPSAWPRPGPECW